MKKSFITSGPDMDSLALKWTQLLEAMSRYRDFLHCGSDECCLL